MHTEGFARPLSDQPRYNVSHFSTTAEPGNNFFRPPTTSRPRFVCYVAFLFKKGFVGGPALARWLDSYSRQLTGAVRTKALYASGSPILTYAREINHQLWVSRVNVTVSAEQWSLLGNLRNPQALDFVKEMYLKALSDYVAMPVYFDFYRTGMSTTTRWHGKIA